jgi:hypothetical protein
MRQRLMRASAPLAVTSMAMAGLLAVAVAGLALDPRVYAGAPVWLKPAKFAVSLAAYTTTLGAIFTLLPDWVRMRRRVGWITAVALFVEMAIIMLQAARGTGSHFNQTTLFDAVLFSVMGIIIMIQTVTSVAVAVALWRTPFTDRALGRALRLGMALTIAGALSGGLMAPPRPNQLAEAVRTGQRMTVSGAHTVGAPDGGPGLPGTGWSTEHGDLRIAHFVGLHAVQILPLIALALRRRLADHARIRVIAVAAAAQVTLFVLLLWQALRGQALVAPDSLTMVVLGAWGAVVIGALAVAALMPAEIHRPVLAR